METRHLIFTMITTFLWLNAEACGGGAGSSKEGTTTAKQEEETTTEGTQTTRRPSVIGNITFTMSLDDKDIWNGWEPPPGADDFAIFITTYLEQQEERRKKRGEFGKSKPADAGSDFPKDWEGDGPGMDGFQPPPWAFVPANTGQPAFCLEKPDPGNCTTEKQLRFAYNPYMDECVDFMWKCQGNNNNFKTKESCEEKCVGAYEGGCDLNSRIPIGYL